MFDILVSFLFNIINNTSPNVLQNNLSRGREEEYSDESEEETAQEKRLRLAKKYLQEIEEEGKEESHFLIIQENQ